MDMGPTPVSAASAGPNHQQNVPKSVRVRMLFEFLLYLIRMVFQRAMVDILVSVQT